MISLCKSVYMIIPNCSEEVISFCGKHEINVPEMNSLYIPKRGRAPPNITVEHFYRVDLFIAKLDILNF